MKYLALVLLVLGLLSTACTDSQQNTASPPQTPSSKTASSPTPESPSTEDMLIDSQSARIAALKESIEILESTVEGLEAKDQDAAQLIEGLEAENEEAAQLIEDGVQLIEDLEAENEEIRQRVEDLQSESSDVEEMLNDLRCRSHIDIELVAGGCDWEPPESMPRQVGGWTWSKWEDEDTLSITYTVSGEGSDLQSQPDLRLYCVWYVNSQVLMGIDVKEPLHKAGEEIVSVDYRIGGTERFEVPWRSYSHSGEGVILSPNWEYYDMVFDDLRTGTGTFELTITADGRPLLQVAFEIDGIAEVFELLEPGCRDRNTAIRGNAA